MTKPEIYRSVLKELRTAGLRAHIRPDQLVFQLGSSGKSAYLNLFQGGWVLVTWAPWAYFLAPNTNLPEFCKAFLKHRSTMAILADEVQLSYGARLANDHELGAIFDAMRAPSEETIFAELTRRGFRVQIDEEYDDPTLDMTVSYQAGGASDQVRSLSIHDLSIIRTVGGTCYRVPGEESIEEICANYLLSEDFNSKKLSDQLVHKHALSPLDEPPEIQEFDPESAVWPSEDEIVFPSQEESDAFLASYRLEREPIEQLDFRLTELLLSGSVHTEPRALELASQLVEMDEKSNTSLATKGSILIVLGQVEEGIALLKRVRKNTKKILDHPNVDFDKLVTCVFLSIAYGRLGDAETAFKYKERALKLPATTDGRILRLLESNEA